MTIRLKQFTLSDLLSYIQDCHGVTPYDLEERDISPKSKADLIDAIESYGWAEQCFAYLS